MHYADFLIDFAIKCFLSFWDCTFLLAGSHTQVLTKLHHRAELMQVMNVCSSASFLLLAQIRLDDASRMQWFDIVTVPLLEAMQGMKQKCLYVYFL